MRPRCLALVAALLWLLPGPLLSYEPLSEAELDRTVASGLEAAGSADHTDDTTGESGRAYNDISDTEAEFTLIAYRNALPIVMNRMTSTSKGPLGRNGRYSLSPLDGIRSFRTPVSGIILRLGPLPARFVSFGR